MSLHPVDLAIAGAYVAGILWVGFAVSGHITSFRDWFVAGGRMTVTVLVCTLVSTYYGLDVLFGASEVGYLEGVVGWFGYTRPYYLAILVAALLLARRLKALGALSLPEVAGDLYGRGARSWIAVASFFYSLPLLAVMGIGVLLDVLFGWPLWLGVVLGSLVSLAYTLWGGLLADALTDTVQFTLMCVTLGVAGWIALDRAGGWEGLEAALPPSYFDPGGSYPPAVLWVFGLSALSVLVEPAFYQRIFAARDHRSVIVALGIGVVVWASYDWVVTVLGMGAAASGLETDPRYALLDYTLGLLPVGLAGLFVAGVVATAMSTIDSYLLIAGGNLSYDLWGAWARTPPDDRTMLQATRWSVAASCAAAVAFALLFTSMVSAWVFMATALVSAAVVPVLAGLWWRAPLAPAAGWLSAAAGLGTAALVYAAVNAAGEVDPEWGTTVWTFTLGGRSWSVWQEYAVLFALPASATGFLVGQVLGRKDGGSPRTGLAAGTVQKGEPVP